MSEQVIQLDTVRGLRVLPPIEAAEPSSINIREDETCYEICTVLPGVDIEDVIIGVADDVLTVGAKAGAETQQTMGRFFAIDHRVTLIEQSFALPPDADARNLTSVFNDGVLRILMSRIPHANIVPLFSR